MASPACGIACIGMVPCQVMILTLAKFYPSSIPHKWELVSGLIEADTLMEGKLLSGPDATADTKVALATEAADLTLDIHLHCNVFL